MAITTTAKPHAYVPAGNDIYFGSTSDKTTQPNFMYYITVAVGANTFTFVKPARPTTADLVFNCRKCIEKALQQYYPFGQYGWQTVNGGILQITVNIGERYGTTLTIYPGTNYQFYVWNAVLEREERRTYLPATYQYPNCLNQIPSATSGKTDKDLTFYWLLPSVSALTNLTVTTYDVTGATLGIYKIGNPFVAVTTPNLYICINAGWTGLTNITSGVVAVSGSLPIITPTVVSYQLAFNGPSSSTTYTVSQSNCCSAVSSKTLFYLNRYGAFDVINLCANSRKTTEITKTFYRAIDNYFEGSYLDASNAIITPSNPLDINKRVLSNVNELKEQLTSGYLNDSQVALYSECWKASKHFLQNTTNDYRIVVQEDNSFAFKQGKVDKLIQFVANISHGHVNRRQSI